MTINYSMVHSLNRKKFRVLFCPTQAFKARKETVDCDDRAVIVYLNGT